MDLFEYQSQKAAAATRPLAERMRPGRLDEFMGQTHIVGEGSVLRKMIEQDTVFSMILWGPPGCGKTTLAKIISSETRSYFVHFSAVLSGVKDIRAVIDEAGNQLKLFGKRTILFVDEIHRFNKAQQDAFLHHVENGLITLIGATTENPSFEVISPLLSRSRVMILKRLSADDINTILHTALQDKERGLGNDSIRLDADAMTHLIAIADGDARVALNSLEIVVAVQQATAEMDAGGGVGGRRITLTETEAALQAKALTYDKDGEEHYNLISALHKSLRGSDPDAAVYWLSRMLAAGEDPLYIVRRMVRFASEDVGNADPYALDVALNAMEAFKFIGPPEGELALIQAAVYLACAPKSNSLYVAHHRARKTIRETGSLPVPLHIRNAPTPLMKDIGYGKNYKYAHDYDGAYTRQEYLPDDIKKRRFYLPTERGFEKTIKDRLDRWRRMKKKGNEANR